MKDQILRMSLAGENENFSGLPTSYLEMSAIFRPQANPQARDEADRLSLGACSEGGRWLAFLAIAGVQPIVIWS